MCDLIFGALKAQNQTASQQEQGTHNQGLENKKNKAGLLHFLNRHASMSGRLCKIVSNLKAYLQITLLLHTYINARI